MMLTCAAEVGRRIAPKPVGWTMQEPTLRTLNRLDTLFALAFFCAGAVVAVIFVLAVGKLFFYQSHMSEMVMAACGKKFASPTFIPPALEDFLYYRVTSFDCALLEPVKDTRGVGALAQAHLYLARSVSVLWLWFGVSYQSLAPLVAALNGAYVAGCFVLSRLLLHRTPSCLIALVLLLSPIAVSMLFYLRDFAKAPFVVWGLVLVLLSLRVRTPTQLVGISIGLGLLIGIGAGFRSDVMMILFPLSLGILLFAPSSQVVKLPVRLLSLASFLISVLVVTNPLRTDDLSGTGGFYMMQGMSEPFRAHLGLGPAPYDLGFRYADEVTFSSISSDLRRADPSRYDAQESGNPEQLTQAYRQATSYVLRWLPIFAADVATRAIKSSLLMAGYYGAFSPERRVLDPFPAAFVQLRASVVLLDYSVRLIDLLSHRWLPTAIGTVGLATLLLRVFARAPREAAALAIILATMLSFPSMQFSSRHFFHLEIFVWLGIGSLLVFPFEAKLPLVAVRRFTAWAAALAAVLLGTYLGLLAVQDRDLRAEIDHLLAGPRTEIITSLSELPGDRLLLKVPTPPEHAAILEQPPDSLSLPAILTVMPSRVISATDRLMIEI
ncbi:MAG: hypothetical protein K0Q64_1302, partial [Nitrobacter vulgaris]|nr:hypothetical protein [Nitrobacter vulgaris]